MSVQAHLYAGDAMAALLLCREAERGVESSLLKHVQMCRGFWLYSRAISATAVAALGGDDRDALLRRATKDGRRLSRENAPWCVGLGRLVHGGVAHVLGNDEAAATHLRAAVELLDRVEMSLQAAAARYRLGEIVDGDEGAALVANASAMLADLGFVDAPRSVAAVAPGYR